MAVERKKIDELGREQESLDQSLAELKLSESICTKLINDTEVAVETWDKIKVELEREKEVQAPSDTSKKRKLSAVQQSPRKKATKGPSVQINVEVASIDVESNVTHSPDGGERLSPEAIEIKLAVFKEKKINACQEKNEIDTKVKDLQQQLEALEKNKVSIETAITAICIGGRNNYSKGAIQQDFADGIRELDMESAQEEDPEQFNPDEELRDYSEIARALPVFCVSSRAYQKLRGRLQRDNDVKGFRSPEETEIPQLQAHCKKLTEEVRTANCRHLITNLCQTLTSLRHWASNDGTGIKLSDTAFADEVRFLKSELGRLEKSFEKAVTDCMKEMKETLAEHIFEKFDRFSEIAAVEANNTVEKWHSPVNRDDHALGGFYWGTYKAIVRRDGVFDNTHGLHNLNLQLTEPIIKHLASTWESVFAQKLPPMFKKFSEASKKSISLFHNEVKVRSMRSGAGVAGLELLREQLKNHGLDLTTLSKKMKAVINVHQRQANREFSPVIERHMLKAYEWCSIESGNFTYC